MRCAAAALVVAIALAPLPGHAQDVKRTPLAAGHPLVGTWRLDLPQTACHELYSIRADGTMHVTSGEQAAQSEFEVSAAPSAKGFYKWVDRITGHNGKADCGGEVMETGHVATTYLLFAPAGDMFLLCEEEDPDTCIGPFVRQPGI